MLNDTDGASARRYEVYLRAVRTWLAEEMPRNSTEFQGLEAQVRQLVLHRLRQVDAAGGRAQLFAQRALGALDTSEKDSVWTLDVLWQALLPIQEARETLMREAYVLQGMCLVASLRARAKPSPSKAEDERVERWIQALEKLPIAAENAGQPSTSSAPAPKDDYVPYFTKPRPVHDPEHGVYHYPGETRHWDVAAPPGYVTSFNDRDAVSDYIAQHGAAWEILRWIHKEIPEPIRAQGLMVAWNDTTMYPDGVQNAPLSLRLQHSTRRVQLFQRPYWEERLVVNRFVAWLKAEHPYVHRTLWVGL